MNKLLSIEKSGKKTARILFLLGIRESYLFLRNFYGFFEHPQLTTHKILKEKDLSQGLLFFSLPIFLWFIWLFVLLFSRFFIFGRLQFGFLAKASFCLSSLASLSIFLFFSGLLYLVFHKERRNE